LDLIRNFIVFEKDKKVDTKTGLMQIETVKKIAAYHQYHAVNKAVESTRLAVTEKGNRKAGVVWHTQGSGKSLSMVFYAGKLIHNLDNTIVVIRTGTISTSSFLIPLPHPKHARPASVKADREHKSRFSKWHRAALCLPPFSFPGR
jgi:hypothetical protein